MPLDKTNSLISHIQQKRKERLCSKRKLYPANNFRASDIGECDRQMVYSVLDWDKKALYDEGLQAIFDAGIKEEENVKQRLGYELGLSFIEQQKPFEFKNRSGEVICRGHIDGKILFEGEAIPIEIKSMNENVFNSIKTIEDFNKKPLHRKYLRQMQMYLFGNNQDSGIFILSNFRTEKLIPVTLNFEECEDILKRLETNWELVKKKQYPERIEYEESTCGYCPFKHICLPEITNAGAELIDDMALLEKLNRREELKAANAEYKELDEEIKEVVKERPEIIVGTSWRISGKWIDVTKYEIPDEVKKQYSYQDKQWRTKIIKI